MSARNIKFVDGEYYHVYNRGVDKRDIFIDEEDFSRFMQSIKEFNDIEPIGSIYENSFNNSFNNQSPKLLVSIVCFCLNQNHFHFIFRQESERGIEKFMQRLGGYPKYFNNKYKRSGALFQGKFKAKHIVDNKYLLNLSVYVNLNDKVHQLGCQAPKLMKSSWEEFVDQKMSSFCRKDIVLGQFENQSDYKKFALNLLPILILNKKESRDLED